MKIRYIAVLLLAVVLLAAPASASMLQMNLQDKIEPEVYEVKYNEIIDTGKLDVLINNQMQTVYAGSDYISISIVQNNSMKKSDDSYTVDKNTITLKSDKADFAYTVEKDKLKEYITVKEPVDISFTYTTSDGLSYIPNPDNSITFYRADEPIFRIESPFVIDADGTRFDIKYKITKDTLSFDGDLSKCIYPITIDPTIAILDSYGTSSHSIVRDSNNVLWVVIDNYAATSPDDRSIYIFNSSDNGNTWFRETVYNSTLYALSTPSLFINSSGSKYVFFNNASPLYTLHCSINSNGTWSIPVTPSISLQTYHISIDENDTFHIFNINTSDKVYYATLNNTGFSTQSAIVSSGVYNAYVRSAYYGNVIHVAWSDSDTMGYIKYINKTAGSWSSVTNVTTTQKYSGYLPFVKDLITNNTGTPYILYGYTNSSNYRFSNYTYLSDSWRIYNIYSTNSSCLPTSLYMSRDNSSIFHVLWTMMYANESTNVYDSQIVYRNFTVDNTISSPQLITDYNFTTRLHFLVNGDSIIEPYNNVNTGWAGVFSTNSTSGPHEFLYLASDDFAWAMTIGTDFTANITSGPAPLTIQFTDTSTHSPTSWLWDFGDGDTSTDQNPVHTYTNYGDYTVNLTASNALVSYTESKPDYITATPPEYYVVSTCFNMTTFNATNATESSVTLNGRTNETTDVWFAIGSTPSTLSYYTESEETTGNYSTTVDDYPFVLGQTYYYAATSDCGHGGVKSFSIPAATPIPTTTYTDRFDDLVDARANWSALAPIIGSVYTDLLGVMVYAIIWLAIIGAIWIRTEDARLPLFAYILISLILSLNHVFPASVVNFIYVSIVIAFAGMIYPLMKGSQKTQ